MAAGPGGAEVLPGPPPTPSRRDSDHQREVQQLYEEMEQQIGRQKQQLQAKVGSGSLPSPALDPSAGPDVGPCLASVGQQEVAGSGSSHTPD